jgi:hypothetical protein
MNEKDLLAVALKHKLPMIPQEPSDYPWAYAEQVLAFGRELAGEEWPDNYAFPPLPMSVVSHPALGSMYARFDLQMYAVQFERRTLKRIGAALGLTDGEEGKIENILDIAKDYRINADSAALNSWWVRALCEFWGEGKVNMDTRRAAKVACNMAAQVCAANGTKNVHIGSDFDEFLAEQGILEEVTQAALPDLRDEFESLFKLPSQCQRCGDGYTATAFNAWDAHSFMDKWAGFKAARNAKPAVECAARKQGTAGGNDAAGCEWPACGCDPVAGRVIESLMGEHNLALTFAQRDVLKERAEQCTREGFTPAHDDAYAIGQLAEVGACYAHAFKRTYGQAAPLNWPWGDHWWKPTTPRRNLVKAAACIIAEIEKMDRAQVKA